MGMKPIVAERCRRINNTAKARFEAVPHPARSLDGKPEPEDLLGQPRNAKCAAIHIVEGLEVALLFV